MVRQSMNLTHIPAAGSVIGNGVGDILKESIMEISNYDDVIDSRQVIERITELETIETGDRTEEETVELATLQALTAECSNYAADWEYGVTLVRDSYFQKYAEELAEDLGAVDSDAKWPMSCIDWEQAARELRMDYTSVSFNGVDYWVR